MSSSHPHARCNALARSLCDRLMFACAGIRSVHLVGIPTKDLPAATPPTHVSVRTHPPPHTRASKHQPNPYPLIHPSTHAHLHDHSPNHDSTFRRATHPPSIDPTVQFRDRLHPSTIPTNVLGHGLTDSLTPQPRI